LLALNVSVAWGLWVCPFPFVTGRQVQVTTETERDEDETRKKKRDGKRSVLELLKKGVLGHFSPRNFFKGRGVISFPRGRAKASPRNLC
jgi:hypothetical protein